MEHRKQSGYDQMCSLAAKYVFSFTTKGESTDKAKCVVSKCKLGQLGTKALQIVCVSLQNVVSEEFFSQGR